MEIEIKQIDYILLKFPDGKEGKVFYVDTLPIDNYFNVLAIMTQIQETKEPIELEKKIVEFVFACSDIDRNYFLKNITKPDINLIYEKLLARLDTEKESKKKDT